MAKKNLLDLIASQAATLADSSASIPSSFRSTESISEVNEALQHQIQKLETEVINLRIATDGDRDKEFLEKQIQELTAKLSQISGEHEIEIELLDLDPDQPRSIFPQHLIEERAESLRRNEQISPIIVIPQPNGRYRIFDGALRKLAEGLPMMETKTRPAQVQRLSARRFRMVLKEGKNRQIRRMVRKVGNQVTRLKRTRIACIKLGRLPLGTWRFLKDSEKQELLKML